MKTMHTFETLPEMVPLREVAQRFQVTVKRLVRASRRGEFPEIFNPAKGIWLMRREDLDRVIREQWTDLQAAADKITNRWIRSRVEEAAGARQQRAVQEK